jgi:uncharacterized membrane protein YsdA (DUF1294 family)
VKYDLIFGVPAVLSSLALYQVLDRALAWPHYYFSWFIAISVVTLACYGLDKGLSKARGVRARVPELVLNLLAVAGGSPGAWLGRTLFRHKTNLRRHWLMFAILVVSSVLHVYVLHTLYSNSLGW